MIRLSPTSVSLSPCETKAYWLFVHYLDQGRSVARAVELVTKRIDNLSADFLDWLAS